MEWQSFDPSTANKEITVKTISRPFLVISKFVLSLHAFSHNKNELLFTTSNSYIAHDVCINTDNETVLIAIN